MSVSAVLIFVGTVLLFHGGNSKIIKPGSPGELQTALDQAQPGDTIQMLPTNYVGDFVISTNGPCTLVGDGNTTIESAEIGMLIKGSGWILKSFKMKGAHQGIVCEGGKNSLEGIVVQKAGKAMVVKGEENTIKGCVISEADLGITLEGSKNNLHSNSINTHNLAIVIPPESCCGFLKGNVANGEIHLDGNNYRFYGNVANHGLYVKGCNNEFAGNVANGVSFPKECQSIDKGGNVFRGLGQREYYQQQGTYQQPGNYQQPQQGYQPQGGSNPAYPGSFGGSQNGAPAAQHQSQPNYNQQQQQGNAAPGYDGSFTISGSSGSQSVPVQYTGSGVAPKCSCRCTN